MNDIRSTTVRGRVVTPDGVLTDGWVRVDGTRIDQVGSGPGRADVRGEWIVPGFVDIHCHGGGGGSFTSSDLRQIRTAVDTHRAHGTTTMLASLVSASIDALVEQVAMLGELVSDGDLAGTHLEGPFLSVARCGAHDPMLLRPPDLDSLRRLVGAGRGTISMITLAPELDNALDSIRYLADSGVIAAIGHTNAVVDQIAPAINAGASVATHLFNGMRPLHHREPGPVGGLLDDERIAVELICDLVHVHPTALRLAARHAGPARTVLVTDAISATAAGDGDYELGGLTVTVEGGAPRLADGSLAGSTLTMDTAFRNAVTRCGLEVTDAVAATATTPAQVLGLADRVGSIRPGMDADLVVLDAEFAVRAVLCKGRWVDLG